jgi:hypothetical protein
VTPRYRRAAAALMLVSLLLACVTTLAQSPAPVPAPAAPAAATAAPAAVTPTVAQPTPAINFRERPRFPNDPQRLRRRPAIDGSIGADEWDVFYTVTDAPVNGTVYLNWDDEYVYVAFKTDAAAWVVFDLDTSGDGWLRGADNLELTVPPLTDGGKNPLTARILDAASGRDAPVWNDRVVDPKSVTVAAQASGAGQVVEIAIPKGIAGMNPRANAMMSCRADFLPAAVGQPAATAPYEPHLLLDFTLVDSRATGVVGIAPRLVLEDTRMIPGQTLHATLEIANQTDIERAIRSVSWQGEGSSADILKSLREVAVPPVKGLKTAKLRYSSPLPESAVPGYYQLTARAELDQGRSVVSTVSFSVVEAVQTHIEVEPESVTILGPTKVKLTVVVESAVPGYAKGTTELILPAGWDVKGGMKHGWTVDRADAAIRQVFGLTLPSTTQAGEYVLNATVTWRGKTWKAHKTIRVDRSPSPEAPQPVAPAAPAK